MKITLLDAETLGSDLCFDSVKELGETVIFQNTAASDVAKRIDDSHVLIINKIKLNEDNLKNARNLKLICIAATGYDNIDLTYCKKRGIGVCNVVGYSTHSVAQLTLAMVLSLSTHLSEYNAYVSSGAYTASNVANCLTPVYRELFGKVWGIVGCGNIGKQVARVAESLGCSVIGFKRTPDKNFSCHDLSYLCKNSDIISVHLPLSSETQGLIDKKMIAAMKPNALFINVSRGAVADEEALTEAVLNKKIGGIGIDVYSAEPFPKNHPYNSLFGLPNVCLTPHMGWGAFEARERCLNEIMLNIKSFSNGGNRNRLV